MSKMSELLAMVEEHEMKLAELREKRTFYEKNGLKIRLDEDEDIVFSYDYMDYVLRIPVKDMPDIIKALGDFMKD